MFIAETQATQSRDANSARGRSYDPLLSESLDFAAGRVQRAPKWLQKVGLEWAFRMWLEPKRLVPRYTQNALFLFRMVGRDLLAVSYAEPAKELLPTASKVVGA